MAGELENPHRNLPALDGVRGVAILLVLATHLVGIAHPAAWGEPHAFFSNFIISLNTGVDLFFVLSGFLITGILLQARGGKNYFRNFYVRRALRIFPLYYASIALLALYFYQTGAWAGMSQRLPWMLAYGVNIRNWMLGHFDFTVAGVSMDHFWSLSVEEQFYLIWPAVVLVLDSASLRRVCLACVVLAAFTRICSVWNNPLGLAGLGMLPCRMDAFAVGALIALEVRQGTGLIMRNTRPIFLVSLVAFLLACCDRNVYPILMHTATPWLYACVIVAAIQSPLVGAAMSNGILRSFGKFSYAIYILHVPILGIVRLREPQWGPWTVSIAVLATTYAAAVGSWYLLESPFLRLKSFFPYAPLPNPAETAPDGASKPDFSAKSLAA